MPRPTNKDMLISQAQKEFDLLEKMLAPLSSAQWVASPAPDEWSIKDILAHLHEWQQMFFRWYEAGLGGETPALPTEGFKWNQLPALNARIYATYLETPLAEVQKLFHASHQKTMDLVVSLSQEDLFLPGRYSWTGSHPLAAFINANLGSHYRWARGEVRKRLRPPEKKGR